MSSSLGYIELGTELQNCISKEQAWHYRIVPKTNAKDAVVFYIDDQVKVNGQADELEAIFGKKVEFEALDSAKLQKTLSVYYRKNDRNGGEVKVYNKKADNFLDDLIAEARSVGSSDIHVEVYEERCRVRIRIDGKLIERYTLDHEQYPSFVNKIKIKSSLDISEKRLPQDGRIFFKVGKDKFDIRVSCLPTLYGEKIVMRLLGSDAGNINIESLGFGKEELENYLEGVKKPHGIVLISGPTGSGKTTTLYATHKVLNNTDTNIVTVEDPIEYTLEGINQVQLKENIGLTFASTLRSFLRQDPDIIMLGEIRDGETAEMAVRAALTGHLVLSTIHTNSAWGTISRLVDMGVAPFLIASTLNTSVAQRLVRLLCPHCKSEEEFKSSAYPRSFKPVREIKKHYVAKGCESCYYTGYKGRKALYEVITIDYELGEMIKNGNFAVRNELKERGIKTLAENAFDLFESGETSINEVYPMLLNDM